MTGALATKLAASNSIDAQVVRLTCAVAFSAFRGSLTMVIATIKIPTAKRLASCSFL